MAKKRKGKQFNRSIITMANKMGRSPSWVARNIDKIRSYQATSIRFYGKRLSGPSLTRIMKQFESPDMYAEHLGNKVSWEKIATDFGYKPTLATIRQLQRTFETTSRANIVLTRRDNFQSKARTWLGREIAPKNLNQIMRKWGNDATAYGKHLQDRKGFSNVYHATFGKDATPQVLRQIMNRFDDPKEYTTWHTAKAKATGEEGRTLGQAWQMTYGQPLQENFLTQYFAGYQQVGGEDVGGFEQKLEKAKRRRESAFEPEAATTSYSLGEAGLESPTLKWNW